MDLNHRFTRLLPSVIILFFLLATTTAAQADRASISGTVTDKSGAVILMAEISDPYVAAGQANPYDALFGGTPSYSLLNGIPWDRLQVIAW